MKDENDPAASIHDVRDMLQSIHDMQNDPSWRAACKKFLSTVLDHAATTDNFTELTEDVLRKCLDRVRKDSKDPSWLLSCKQMASGIERIFEESLELEMDSMGPG